MRNDLKPLWLGIVLLLIVLTINGYVTFLSFQRVTRNNAQVEHSQQLLLETERLKSLLVDAETGQRGYLYTGDLHYLEPYNQARSEEHTSERSSDLNTASSCCWKPSD